MIYRLLRSFLFRLDAETAHTLALSTLRFTQSFSPALGLLKLIYSTRSEPVTAFGLTFKNPVGLAAGYDKDALAVRGLAALGFGHLEVGTVTPLPQEGNPKPRVFRLVEDEAVINRMGFPSRGAEFVQNRLRALRRARRRPDWILGVNIGKNAATPNEEAVLDYLSLLQSFAPLADYLAINVSSPNTVGLRDLQAGKILEELLSHLHAQRRIEQESLGRRVPLLVKLAPDLSPSELDEAVDIILSSHMDGVIATNTTLTREGLRSRQGEESGGMSGSPLRVRSEAVLSRVAKRVDGRIPVISAGGVMNPEDARRRLDMGAALIQIYTGLIYRGPGLVRQAIRDLGRD